MSKVVARDRSNLSAARLRAVLLAARREGHEARVEMRGANRAVLRALLARDDAAALLGREREQIARASLRRSTEIIAAALAELADLGAASSAPEPLHLSSISPLVLQIIRDAISKEIV